jgi:hypothetical protein
MQRFRIIFIISSIAILFSCAKDKLEENGEVCSDDITYQDDVRPILDRTCAYTGCHDGSSAPGDFTSYNRMLPFLNEDKFERRVIDRRDMPPNYSSGPTALTAEELAFIRCWAEGGYLEN